jgi:TrfA protein
MSRSPELDRQLESLKRTLADKTDLPAVVPSELQRRPVQLPMWPEPVRGGPNAILRSALFAGIHSKKRETLGTSSGPDEEPKGVTVAAQDGITVTFAGRQLNQYDADVFFEALHRARHHPLETECFFRGYDFLKAIGRQDGKREYDDLHNSLTRLRNGNLVLEWQIKGRHYEFNGSLISHYVREKTSKLYKITFAKEIKALFAPACWTQLEWDERQALKGHPLAQWLHSYFSTHAEPFPIGAAFLHQKTGSKRTLLKHFRSDLKNALGTLEKVLGWKASWEGDLLTVTRQPSASQARHILSAKQTKQRRNQPKRGEKGLAPVGELLPSFLKGRL